MTNKLFTEIGKMMQQSNMAIQKQLAEINKSLKK